MNELATLEKAELHCHIDGLLDPEMLDELAADGIDLGLSADALRRCCPVDSPGGFARYFETVDPCLRPAEERLALVLERHLARLRRQRVIYSEIFVSRMLFSRAEIEEVVEVYRALRRRAQAAAAPDLQVELVVCVGRGPPARMERQFPRIMALHRAGLICGVALAGAEPAHPVRPLRPYFERFRDAGLGIEIHAGEHGGPDSVWDAIDNGFPTRLGHAVAAFRDPRLLALLAERRIHLELCPTSNWRLGAVARLEDHPLPRARELGLEISINTDDPGAFGCTLTSELLLAQRLYGLDAAALGDVQRSALRARFGR